MPSAVTSSASSSRSHGSHQGTLPPAASDATVDDVRLHCVLAKYVVDAIVDGAIAGVVLPGEPGYDEL